VLFQVSFLCVLLFSVLTLKALAKDWKASLLLLNLALCYHQHKLTEHAERDALASEKRFVLLQKWTWCRGSLLQEKLEHLVEVQGFAVTKFSHEKLASDNSMFAHLIIKKIIRLSKGLSQIMATSLDTLNSSTKLSSI